MKRTIFVFIFSMAAMLGSVARANNYFDSIAAEGSFGQTHFSVHPKETGNWRQPGTHSQHFHDSIDDITNMWSLGFTGPLGDAWRWRAGYANLGTVNSAATATRRDEHFNFNTNQCVYACADLATFVTKSQVQGVYATGVRSVQLTGRTRLLFEAGLWVYMNKFEVWTYAPATNLYPNNGIGPGEGFTQNEWDIGPVIGMGIERDNTSFNITFYQVGHNTPDKLPANNDAAPSMVFSLRHRF